MLLQSEGCTFGDPAPDFTLADATGVEHGLPSLMGERGVLIAFICNHCPYVIDIMPRLALDTIALKSAGINVACINANDYEAYPADAPAHMPAFADRYDLKAPYLIDEEQAVAKAYGAVCTPDFFGFGRDTGLQYRGRLDDVAMRHNPAGRRPELLEAMEQVARTGLGPEVQTPSMGCSLKWRKD